MKHVLPVLWYSAAFWLCRYYAGIGKKDLKMETLSETIFLDVENQTGKKVYPDIKNTSDKEIHMQDMVTSRLSARGFSMVSNAKQAEFFR